MYNVHLWKNQLRVLKNLSPEAERTPPTAGELHKLGGITAELALTYIFFQDANPQGKYNS